MYEDQEVARARHRRAAARGGVRITARRQLQASKLTIEEAADRAGVQPRTLRLFLDEGRWPQAATRRDIERAVGWEPGYMDLMVEQAIESLIAATADDPAWDLPTIPDDLTEEEINEVQYALKATLNMKLGEIYSRKPSARP